MVACVLMLNACAHHAPPPPNPDAPSPHAPDMTSLKVMILPAQPAPAASRAHVMAGEPVPGLDAELGYFLTEQAPRVQWVPSDVVKKGAANARTINVHPDALSVSQFTSAQLKRIGDPLWGDLRLLGEVINARYALLPFAAGFVNGQPTGTHASQTRVEIGAALIDTGNGNVLWTGYVAGDYGEDGSRSIVASAARALALKFAP
jgi:hypothetical protein